MNTDKKTAACWLVIWVGPVLISVYLCSSVVTYGFLGGANEADGGGGAGGAGGARSGGQYRQGLRLDPRGGQARRACGGVPGDLGAHLSAVVRRRHLRHVGPRALQAPAGTAG